jgi:hypothetical protein
MRGEHPTVMAAAALLALTAVVGVASSDNSPAPPKADQAAPPAVTILPKHEVEGILGRQVRSAADENMGRIVDVLVDRGGQVRAAIIDFGGFLGVGSRKIAVDWRLLQLKPVDPDAPVVLSLTRADVQAAPEYKPSSSPAQPVVVVGPPPPSTDAPASSDAPK